jgi:hypothetical protein
MKIVHITDGIYYGKKVEGQFPFVSEKEGDANCKREMYVRVIQNGKEVNVHSNRADYKIVEDTAAKAAETPVDELDTLIARRFDIMEKLTNFVVEGNVRSMIISGAAGIGKSYNLDKRLNQAIDNAEINQFSVIKGKVSPIALFQQLFEHRNKGDVLVLDDIDVIFQDETSLNLLKGALDTGDVRRLSWLTASDWLEEQGVDQVFEFEGACVFITNLDFDRMVERGSNLTPHFRALMSRSIYLDLAIHSNKEILTRIKQVVNTTSMLDVHGIDGVQKAMMMEWMEENYENLRELSLRTILKLAAFMKGDPKGWRDIAEATMVRNNSFTIAAQEALSI